MAPIDEIQETSTVDVIVVGAGFAGLYAVHRLRGDGFTVQAFESGDGVGGTWYWNRYPGARCDVESIDYQYSFSPELLAEWTWSERYPAQPEILAYLNHVADRFDLRRSYQFGTSVTSAEWDDDTGHWTVQTDGGTRVNARHVVMASGMLSVPNSSPDIPGLETFTGQRLHTATWPAEPVDLSGKRVAVIGTGSTAIQAIPHIAREADHLLVLQRTANYALPAISTPWAKEEADMKRAEFEQRRHYAKHSFLGLASPLNDVSALSVSDEERERTFEEYFGMGGLPMYGVFNDILFNPEANRLAAEFVAARIRSRVNDPNIAEKLVPRGYPFGTKRLCVEDGYYETFNRDNVTLVDVSATPIDEITPSGIRIDGTEHPVDTIVFATGFDALTGAALRIDPRGKDGRKLSDEWADGPVTYLGVAVAGFPNLFMVTGPGNPGALSNAVISIEQNVDWITDALNRMREEDIPVMEATTEAQEQWTAQVADIASASLFPQAKSWYMGANIPGKPKVFSVFLGGVGKYREICDQIAAGGYTGFRRMSANTHLVGAK